MPDLKSQFDSRLRAASWRILTLITPRQQGKYLTAVLAALAIAEMGQANLPAALAGIGSSIGIEALGSLLGKLSEKSDESLDEEMIIQSVIQAIEESNLEKSLEENATVTKAVQQLPSWQSLMERLINENQQLARDILRNQNNLTGKVDEISASLKKVSTKEQGDEIKELLLEIVDFLTQPDKPETTTASNTTRPKRNPFGLTGRIEDSKYYLVREPFTQTIFDELGKGVSLSIVGDSQTGKSSLLWHIYQAGPNHLNRPATDFVYIDMQLIHNENDFYACISDELNVPMNQGFLLGRSLKGRQIVVCLDEIEKMTWGGFTLNVRTDLRGLADGQGAPLTLIIASRTPLDKLFPDSPNETSPLANICRRMDMPNFSPTEIRSLMQQYLEDYERLFSDKVLDRIWQQTQGHPFTVQDALRAQLERLG